MKNKKAGKVMGSLSFFVSVCGKSNRDEFTEFQRNDK